MSERITKRQRQAQVTKRALFESALVLFKEKGYESVTVEDITQRAGTAKGSFYTYFRTKSDILIEEFRTIDQYYRVWSRNLRRYPDTRAKLVALTRAQMRYVRDNVGLTTLKILYASNIVEPTTEKILIDTSRYLHQLVQGLIEEGQAAGEVRTDVPAQRLAQLYNRAFRAVFLDWAIANEAYDLVKDGVEFCEVIALPAISAAAQGGRPPADFLT
jgi:AcrR family transcriptional regulator